MTTSPSPSASAVSTESARRERTALLDDEAVDDDLDGVLPLLVEGDLLAQLVDAPVHADAHEAPAPRRLEDLLVLPLAPADDRGEDVHPRPLGQGRDAVDDLLGHCEAISRPHFGQCGRPIRA